MTQLTHTTKSLKEAQIDRKWHLIDARGKILGRVATEIAEKLIGKHKPTYSPQLDNGDYVVVINAALIKVTGRKLDQKVYSRYSGYPGGLRTIGLSELLAKSPKKVIENAVSGMLPKNKLRQPRMIRLEVFSHDKHTFNDKF